MDRDALLLAVARFLEQDARPALSDPALAFRARVAAALLKSVAAESAAAEALETAELARLRGLLGALREDEGRGGLGRPPHEDEGRGGLGRPPHEEQDASEHEHEHGSHDRQAALRTLERALCDRVRAGLPPEDLRRVRLAARDGLRARLAVTTPDFDLSPELE